jgi:caffeoyl-CoA O-methyltransferase
LLLRPGGLIAVDNTLAVSGAPIMKQQTASAKALRTFNDLVHRDERVDLALLTVGEGLTLLRKRE